MSSIALPRISHVALDELSEVAAVMERGFDPLYGEAWNPAQCLAVLTMPGYALRVARGDRGIVGFAIVRWVADESELLLIAVDPAVRRMGVGSALLADWLALVADKGVRRFFLEMRTDNPALSLYIRHGFTECGIRPAYYRGPDGTARDAVTMQREHTD